MIYLIVWRVKTIAGWELSAHKNKAENLHKSFATDGSTPTDILRKIILHLRSFIEIKLGVEKNKAFTD